QATSAGVDNSWHYPMGLSTPAATVAMIARRYMHDYGATSEDFGRITVADRRHAAANPKAWFYRRPVTLAEHQASRWIAEPLRLLEELGFCPRGEARHFISGGAIELDGALPLNPHGGQLGEAYIHGMNGVAEAVRQIRGTSVNQVSGDGPVLVTAGTGVPTSGLILGPD